MVSIRILCGALREVQFMRVTVKTVKTENLQASCCPSFEREVYPSRQELHGAECENMKKRTRVAIYAVGVKSLN